MTTFTVHDLGTPGLKGILSIIHSFPLPEVCKVFSFSGVFGTGAFAVGTDVAFDTASGNFTKYNAGLTD
uniref:Legume lectin domain-containing protein n=1 Tax=Oryza barthii TaxID=65489 RepID=A0A0D3G7S3_9ORYZ